MIDPYTFNVVSFFSACVPNLAARFAYYNGLCSPWFARTMGRFNVVVFAVTTIVDATAGLRWHVAADVIITAIGLIAWNWPSDDEPPRRRRKREKKVEERIGFDWTGVQPAKASA